MNMVYFIQVQPLGPIKIGTTHGHISLRMRALQQTSPHVLKWIGCFKGGKAEEAAAHKLLANSRVRGEWFFPTQEVLQFIMEKSPDFSEEKYNADVFMDEQRLLVKKAIPRWDRTDGRNQIAAASGLGHYTLNKWLTRAQTVDPAKAKRAAECAERILAAASQ